MVGDYGGPGFSYAINPYSRFYTSIYLAQNQRPAFSIVMWFTPPLWSRPTGEGAPAAAPPPPASESVGDAVAGKEAFTQKCSICHGVGARGFIGPYIAGVNWGTLGLHTIVRVGIGGYGSMPAFNADAVTDKDIANIVVYLATLPPNETPLAQHGTVVAANLVNGQKLYAANCASSHGATGHGGVCPELHGENTRKDTAGTIVWIKNPILPMPTLYPKPLGEKRNSRHPNSSSCFQSSAPTGNV